MKASLEFIDTHAHLGDAQFTADREAVLARAAAKGVARVIEIADAPSEWEAALALSRERPAQVRCALGLHPYYSDQFSEVLLDNLKSKIRLPEVVAVGEIGLDYVKSSVLREVQRPALERLLSACKDWDTPAVIHCRGAYEDLRTIVGGLFPAPSAKARFWGVVHCFSGNPDDAVFFAERGFALGADGPVTYPKNDSLREAFRQAGLSCLVLETDSPYLPPQSSRGKRNEPSALPEIAAKMAAVLEVPVEELARATSENARALFRL